MLPACPVRLSAASRSFAGKIAAPPPQERVPKRFGGGYRAATSEYDWFYGLSRAEQARLRENWFTHGKGGTSPDEVEDMGLTMTEWLALTRGIDAAKAVKVGRVPTAARFGGRNPLAFISRGRPEDHGQRVARITSKRHPSKWHDIDRGAHVQYFVADGVVHPIRASYPATPNSPPIGSRAAATFRSRCVSTPPVTAAERPASTMAMSSLPFAIGQGMALAALLGAATV